DAAEWPVAWVYGRVEVCRVRQRSIDDHVPAEPPPPRDSAPLGLRQFPVSRVAVARAKVVLFGDPLPRDRVEPPVPLPLPPPVLRQPLPVVRTRFRPLPVSVRRVVHVPV